ncbi:MAG: HAD-IC family P-type ATPase [Oscillospiraceae bacterium]|nr:HAD-IC family P-type ATPase [Oscillospiraceae bacterium]
MNGKTKSVARIFKENLFTLFNLINLILAAFVIYVGSYRNALFLGVAVCSSIMGIVQELRAKRALDKLAIISEPKARVIRGGEERSVHFGEIVSGDIMILCAGMQVCADALVIEGECEADESLITGESDAVFKSADSELFSGSFILSGYVKARAIRVGADSVSGKITEGAMIPQKNSSEMICSINRIIRVISVCIVPIGVVLFCKSLFIVNRSPEDGITGTVAALIGMIPEGLVLLTGIALSLSALRLSRQHTLCRDLYCVEPLARVDVLCLDKTGTLTEGKMELSYIEALDSGFDVKLSLNAFAAAFPEANPTLKAIRERFSGKSAMVPTKTVAFNSRRKWSAAYFEGFGTLVLGAAGVLSDDPEIMDKCNALSREGARVLLLAHSPLQPNGFELPEELSPKAMISLSDVLRDSAAETLEFFKEQGVALKIISGDDPAVAAFAARRAGLDVKSIDMTGFPEEKIPEIVESYTVFGRSSPEQKLALIKAMRAAGHKVAMVGDGVNDVMALREADCSVAVQSGSDAARAVSQLVLMNGDLSSMQLAVAEGRRCINNIQRSAALFLTKTVFSLILTAVYLFLPLNYPLKPIQMTLISASVIGIPSFLLAAERNTARVCGGFLSSVMRKAAPCGISAAVGVLLLTVIQAVFGFSDDAVSAMSAGVLAAACFGTLFEVCKPFNKARAAMFSGLLILFTGAAALFPEMFYFVKLSALQWGILTALSAGVIFLERTSERVFNRLSTKKYS